MEYIMKIGPIESNAAPAAAGVERKANASGKPAPAVEASAKVDLSAGLQGTAAAGPAEFDSAKVERIAQAIRDGSYRINADAIADKLISNATELIARPNQ
jgi:negative regulator of flagellin synthesis FlgM